MQVNLRVVILRSSLFHIKHSGVGQETLFLKWRKHLISCCTNHKANRNYWNTTPSTHIPTTGNPGKQCFTYVGCLSFFYLNGVLVWYGNLKYVVFLTILRSKQSNTSGKLILQCKFISWQFKNRPCRRSIKPYINFSLIIYNFFLYFKNC